MEWSFLRAPSVYSVEVTALRAALAIVVFLLGAVPSARAVTPVEARARVEHHLRYVEGLVSHFEALVTMSCPRFPTPDAWDVYVTREADQFVLLMAHLEQAWVEAKRTGDDEVRRVAKAPRRQSDQFRALMDKLETCAQLNGAVFSTMDVWRRVERDVPRLQADIALPQ